MVSPLPVGGKRVGVCGDWAVGKVGGLVGVWPPVEEPLPEDVVSPESVVPPPPTPSLHDLS